MADPIIQTEDLSTLSSDRKAEIERSQSQLGILDNLKTGFSLTAAASGARIIEQEAPALFEPVALDLLTKADVPDNVRQAASIQAAKFDTGLAATKSLLGFRGEGIDLDYRPMEHIEQLIDGIPREYHDNIMSENSLEAAQRTRARILEDLDTHALIGQQNDGGGVRLLGSLPDIDAPLTLFSGGSYQAARTSYIGLRAAKLAGLGAKGQRRAASLTQGVSGGAQAGLVVGGADAYWRETTDGLDLIYSTLGGAALGGVFGTAFNATVLDSKVATLDDFEARVAAGDESFTADVSVEDMYAPGSVIREGSVGASEGINGSVSRLVEKVLNDPLGRVSPRSKQIIDDAHASNHDSGFYDRRANDEGKFWTAIGNSKWTTAVGAGFAAKMYNSESAVMNWLGRTVFESPNGYNRGSATSATFNENYHKLIQTQFEPYTVALKAWSKRNDATYLNSGFGSSQTGRAGFNREVMLEINARRKGVSHSQDPDVILAADGINNAAVTSHGIAKGREGQPSVDGFENIPENAFYTPYNWSGSKIENIIRNSADRDATRQAITEGLAEAYRAAGMAQGKDALAVANAVIRRAQFKDAEVDTSVLSLLQADGKEFLRDALLEDGNSQRAVDGIMKRLVGDQAERAKEGFAKSRNEVDMAQTIVLPDGAEIQVVDLLSNDLFGDWQRYTRRVSGAAALARHGITNRAQRKEIIDAIHVEQRSVGEEITPREELEAMFTNFDGGATKGWSKTMGGTPQEAGRGIATAKRMVQLAWLNKLGLTQLGETGIMMQQNGMASWARRGPMNWLNKEIKAGNQELLDDLAFFTGSIGKDHDYFAQHLNLDEVSVLDRADFQSKAQSHISDAVYVQGFTSLFNQVRTFQQKTAALGISDKVFRALRDSMESGELGDKLEARLFYDFGLDGEAIARMRNLIQDGTIEFDTSGKTAFVNKLNMSSWDADLAEEFAASVTRNINQVVQKSMAGEQDAWMHSGWGTVVSHLKTFPMQATQKQMVRHFRHNDPDAYAAVGYSLATAMVASMVKEGVSFDDRNMDMGDHAKRAFAYSNMTGFIPMVYDPMATMLGLDDKRFNQFGSHAEIAPPILSFANDAMRLPGALGKAALGQADGSDRQALRTLPYANSYLIGDMLNAGATRNRE